MPQYPNYYESNTIYMQDYSARAGQRWDQISQEVWGRPDLGWVIIEHNPDLSDDDKQGFGVTTTRTLKIPVIDESTLTNTNIPDWRQAANRGDVI